MKKESLVNKQCLAALCAAINIIGSFLAAGLKLPIYLDSIGTILISGLLGPGYGILTGVTANIINGITFDFYSFYYIPVQIVTAVLASYIAKKRWNTGWKVFIGSMILSVPASFVSAFITAFVFGGITSSGSTYLIMIIHNMGVNLTFSCFIVQVMTDYIDKLTTILLIQTVFQRKMIGRYYGTL